MNRLATQYKQKTAPALKKQFGYSNPHQVPRLVKVVVGAGLGRTAGDSKAFDTAVQTLATITGQRPIATKAKKSVAGFKIREGQNIGAKVTLRGQRAYEFIDRLVSVALPRVRDFRGLSPATFDGRGGFSLGINDQSIFPEMASSEVGALSLQVNIVTSAKTDDEAHALLKLMGFPFRGDDNG